MLTTRRKKSASLISTWIHALNLKNKWLLLTDQFVTSQAILCNTLLSSMTSPTSYLEIGVDEGRTFRKIQSDTKEGIDPYGTYDATYRMTSQMYFALNKLFWRHTYDVIFIDASHFSLIVDEEINESLRILKPGGFIVLHDTDPKSKASAEIVLSNTLSYLRSISYPHNHSHTASLGALAYNGDVWKSVARIRMYRPELRVFTVENFCCTVIQRGKQKKLLPSVSEEKMNWQYFVKNRKKILNLLPFEEVNHFIRQTR